MERITESVLATAPRKTDSSETETEKSQRAGLGHMERCTTVEGGLPDQRGLAIGSKRIGKTANQLFRSRQRKRQNPLVRRAESNEPDSAE